VGPDRGEMLAVVLAAGRGKRLRPLTDLRSKAMLPVAGRPMIERVLEMLGRGGSDRFVVVVHPGDAALIACLSQPRWADRVRLAYQGRRLGMAHALGCAAPLIREDGADGFLLASCDNLYPDGHVAGLVSRWREGGLDAVLTLMRVQAEQIPTLAVVALTGGLVTEIVEKPRPEDAPSDLGVPALYALSTRLLDYLPQVPVSTRGELELQDALQLLIADGGRVGGLLVRNRATLTCPADLVALNRYFLRHEAHCAVVELGALDDASAVPPVRIEAGAEVGPGCRIGPEAVLEAGCRIEEGAIVRRAVVLRGATVGAGALVEDVVVG